MATRFYLDNDVPLSLRDELRVVGHAAVHFRDMGSTRRSDAYHLLTATLDGQILVTHNRKDYVLLHDAWHRWADAWEIEAPHACILCLPHKLRPRELFLAIDVCIRSSLHVSGEIYTYDPATSWIRLPYQP